jgi:hypothetical protein
MVIGVASVIIFVAFLLRASKTARDEILDEHEDHPER